MNSQSFQQVQKQSQSLAFTPQLQNSLKILQAPATELRTAILEELQNNPLLEEFAVSDVSLDEYQDKRSVDDSTPESETNFDADDFSILERMSEDLREHYEAENTEVSYTSEDEKRRDYFMNSLTDDRSLQQHLIEQAELANCSEQERSTLLYLIGSLDDKGFLTESITEVAATLQMPLDIVEKASELLKSFDPLGIGTVDLKDCLATQLKINGQGDSIAAQIVREHFPLLLKRRISEIANELSVTSETVQKAIETIARLDPAPGRRFSPDTNRIVEPDVTVYKDEYDEWQVELNYDYVPRLRISNTYKEMLAKGTLSKKEREFMIGQMRSGKFLINSIEKRQQTIERIAREILKLQIEFFEDGVAKLRPMTMDTIARKIDVHETTVSRAIANKYMSTPQGVFPFKYFFTTGYTAEDGESISNKTIKEMIKSIVASETNSSPYSDQDITSILAEKSISIARRTVAKYREELGILPVHLRRNH